MTKPNLDGKPREFWIDIDTTVHAAECNAYYVEGLAFETPEVKKYRKGIVHVIEKSYADRLHQQLIEEREHGAKVWEANKEKARRIRELEDALYEILSNVTMPEKYRLCGNRALKRDGEE